MNLKPLRLEDYPSEKHPLVRAILKCGGNPAAFAKLLGIPHQNVRVWLSSKSNCTSPQYCADIERLTYGEITREQLRPDVFIDPPEPILSPQERFNICIGMMVELAAELLPSPPKKRGK